jgi:alkylation response protein AidB-like acyl-CoA dehydrogenase
MEKKTETKYLDIVHEIGEDFSSRSKEYDDNDVFVRENYQQIKSHGFLSAMIPEELGGDGISHAGMCEILKVMGGYCGSTALCLSMHQHLLAANTWKYLHKNEGADILKKVAEKNIVLVSTGARDWLESNGTLKRVKDGYLLTAKKHFASQAPIGDILVTSAVFEDPNEGPQVYHFPVPLKSDGIVQKDNWYTMGMRATGSHTISIDNVFIPESSIVLKRPRGEYHPFWNVVLTVALPLIMSAYVGIAERAYRKSIDLVKSKSGKPHVIQAAGELNNLITTVHIIHKDMIRIANNFDFKPTNNIGIAMLSRKTLLANSCKELVSKAMDLVGGRSFFRNVGLERLFRDVHGAGFHPLPEKQQHYMAGRFVLTGEML